MNILFVSLHIPDDLKYSDMYVELVNELAKRGHHITMIGSSQMRTSFVKESNVNYLRVKAPKVYGEKNLIKKGVAMATLSFYYRRAFSKYLSKEKYDWVLMPTPPITLVDFISYVKKKTNALFYLILRDIHPQSSASLGEIKYKFMVDYLDMKSRKAYNMSELIGCMSQANIDFILKEYPKLDDSKMKILYNWIERPTINDEKDVSLREKYNLSGKFLVLFGGNIALGQRIENIIDLAEHYLSNENIRFIIIGKGVKKDELVLISKEKKLTNIVFIDFMPKNDYLNFIQNVDLGFISINENNAAPTCPSKALSYMSMKIPILALINRNSDYGEIIEKNGAGYWSVGSDKKNVYRLFDKLYLNPELRKDMGEKGLEFFNKELTVQKAAETLESQMLYEK